MREAWQMPSLPPRSQQLVDAVPIRRVRTGVRSVIEVTAYPDSHTNIAVGDLDMRVRGEPRYSRVDSLPLNHREELEEHLAAILDRVVRRGSGARPLRLVVRTNPPTSMSPTWVANSSAGTALGEQTTLTLSKSPGDPVQWPSRQRDRARSPASSAPQSGSARATAAGCTRAQRAPGRGRPPR